MPVFGFRWPDRVDEDPDGVGVAAATAGKKLTFQNGACRTVTLRMVDGGDIVDRAGAGRRLMHDEGHDMPVRALVCSGRCPTSGSVLPNVR